MSILVKASGAWHNVTAFGAKVTGVWKATTSNTISLKNVANITNATGTGSVITFTLNNTIISKNNSITVAGVNPTAYNGTYTVTGVTITGTMQSTITVAGTTTTTYVSGGTASTWKQLLPTLVYTVIDTFTRANTTTGLGTSETGSQPWLAKRGNWFVSSNQAKSTDTPSTYPLAAVEMIDAAVQINLDVDTAGGGTGAAFWVTDANNWWGVHTYNASALAYSSVCATYSSACATYTTSAASYSCSAYGSACASYTTTSVCNSYANSTVCTSSTSGYVAVCNATSYTPVCNSYTPTSVCSTYTATSTCSAYGAGTNYSCLAYGVKYVKATGGYYVICTNPQYSPTTVCTAYVAGSSCSGYTSGSACNGYGSGAVCGGYTSSLTYSCSAYGLQQYCASYTSGSACASYTSSCSTVVGPTYSSVCSTYSSVCATYTSSSTTVLGTRYLRLVKSTANVVTTVLDTAVASLIASIQVNISGVGLVLKAYSSSAQNTQIGTDITYTATGATTATQHGLLLAPGGFDQGTVVDSLTINPN